MKKLGLFVLIIMLFTLAACGQSNNEGGTSNQNANGNDTDTNTNEETSQEVTIEHAMDTTTLDQTPENIVALEYTYAEDLLALGVQPVGLADIEGYNKWVDIEAELSDDVTDVGTRQEPNLETIAQLEPDLIIAPKFRHEGIKDELEKIAPTVFFEAYPQDESITQYDEMVTTFKTIAKAVNKEDKAEEVLADLDNKYSEAKEAIDAADLSTDEFVLTQAFSSQQAPVLRVFTPNSMASKIFEKIGLKNAYEPDQFEVYGYSTLNVESLPALEDANFFYVVQDDDNIFENQLKDNAVWKNLDFVKNDRMYPLGGDAWLFGGPLSAKTVVDQVVNVVESK
ncbi:putative siderophore-binding lipoprotein YfiY [Lentibacillus sp. JNUCC-1]|uniref:ABC transporter substrate-binding protein n=1 Tax=Lentibacillus sp. JNUCC-1 TaxID=2654513 RepID=UPI0012E852C4|nr:iron-siderophore ABC transporter substrate-binding protein [Lentibacillus sp. JNUCC-1]MUV37737.1 putative siderophore-binding lipoprotein YfiY [Lentibacillus sp. JNUCC-1]